MRELDSPGATLWAALAFAALALVLLAATVAGRALFPWPLEWMEGSVLHNALRLARGASLYTAPGADFVPYLYTPLGYAPPAVAVRLFGPELVPARLTSVVGLVLTLVFIARAGARAGRGPLGGALAVGFYALGYAYTGAFYDLLRGDIWLAALLALGAERALAGRSRTALAVFALSFFVKQHGALFLAALSAQLLWSERRRALPPVAAAALGLIAALAVCHVATDGWFTTYTIVLPRAHPLEWSRFFAYFWADLPRHVPVLALAALAPLVRHWREPRAIDALVLAGLVAGASGMAHQGGYDNVRIPAMVMLSVAAAGEIARWITPARPGLLRGAVGLAVALQVALLAWNPARYWPGPRAGERFEALAAGLRACAGAGRSVALDHDLLTGTPFLHMMAFHDLLHAQGTTLGSDTALRLAEALDAPDAPDALAVGVGFQLAPDQLRGPTARALMRVDRALSARYRPCRQLAAPTLTTGYRIPEGVVVYSRR